MSTIEERGNDRAKRKTHEIEARRLLTLMRDSGIPEDTLEVNYRCVANLVIPWDKCTKSPDEEMDYVANHHKTWARSGTYLTIEGGGKENEGMRDRVMNFCLLKAIIANFHETVVVGEDNNFFGERTFLDGIAKVVDFVSIAPILSSFDRSRFDLLEGLSKIPVLALREIDPERVPRENSDAAPIIDSILRTRKISKIPTILTFMRVSASLFKEGGHGKELTDIAKACHDEEAGIIRIMVKEKDK